MQPRSYFSSESTPRKETSSWKEPTRPRFERPTNVGLPERPQGLPERPTNVGLPERPQERFSLERPSLERSERPNERSNERPQNRFAKPAIEPGVHEFPELPRKKVQTNVPQQTVVQQKPLGRVTYAALASTWAEQVKENEEKAKRAAEKEAELARVQVKLNEIKLVASTLLRKKHDSDDDKEVDIGCYTSDHSDQAESSDPDEEVIEEEEEVDVEEDPDAFWTQRKHKGDMY
jgi:hypothetical protein